MKPDALKVISLFSGAGGLDIGFKDAGFEIAVCVESDPSCCDTLRENMKGVPVIEGDIGKITPIQVLKKAGLKPLEAALVIGGPPCQPFSLAGNRKGLYDVRGTLFHQFLKVVRKALPVAFVMENVKGMMNWNNGEAIKVIKKEFEKKRRYKNKVYQYKVEVDCLNAADHGVPQIRERVFFVGNRVDVDFVFPAPTYYDPLKAREGEPHYKRVADALEGLPPADEPSKVAKRVAQTIPKRNKALGYE